MSKSPLGRRLIAAVHSGSLESARELLALGADPNFVAGFHSPLTMAASEDMPDMCAALLAAGAKVDMAVKGVAPLHWAAGLGTRTVDVLLASGADGALRIAETGATAAHIAVEGSNAHALAALGRAGAPLDALDNDGQAPIHHAARAAEPAALAALIEAGAQLDRRDSEGRTALHVASAGGAKALLAAGADAALVDERGYTAAERQTPTVGRLIREAERAARPAEHALGAARQVKGPALGA